MRRKVWVAVFGLLVLAVIAQSMVLVERRASREPYEVRVGPNGQSVTVRDRTAWRYYANAQSFEPTEQDQPRTPAAIQKAKDLLKKKDALWTANVRSRRLPLPAAEDEAMEKAAATVTHELQLSRLPSREFIKTRMLVNRHDEQGPIVDDAETYVVSLDLKLTPDTWQILVEDERHTRIRNRMGALGAFVAVLTILFGCVAGYIRIDDVTKGYYSGRLKVAFAVVLALAAVGVAVMVD